MKTNHTASVILLLTIPVVFACHRLEDRSMERYSFGEAQYFRQREQDLIEKLRRRALDDALKTSLSERTGLADAEILQDLVDLGHTEETVLLLHLVPLVQVAWADGCVSESERRLINEAARLRGVAVGSSADQQLAQWLDRRPADAVFDKTFRVFVAMLEARPAAGNQVDRGALLRVCTEVAEASGGILGLGRVSPDERRQLQRLTEALEHGHRAAVERTVAFLAEE